MSNQKRVSLKSLNAFLRKNKTIDFRTADLLHVQNIDAYRWSGLEDEKESIVEQLKAYQRLLRIVPLDREDLAKDLLKSGLRSSLQIASTPKNIFIQNNLKIFDGDRALAEKTYLRALTIRKAVALQHIAQRQRAEPYTRAAIAG